MPQFSGVNGNSANGSDLNPLTIGVSFGGENGSQPLNTSGQTSDDMENESNDTGSCPDAAAGEDGSWS